MPIYDYNCTSCGSTTEINKKISERDSMESDTCMSCDEIGTLLRGLAAPLVGYSITVNGGYGSRVPSGFKDVLHKIHERAPGSRLDKTSSFM
jgi:putative FmdB family regulatory protein